MSCGLAPSSALAGVTSLLNSTPTTRPGKSVAPVPSGHAIASAAHCCTTPTMAGSGSTISASDVDDSGAPLVVVPLTFSATVSVYGSVVANDSAGMFCAVTPWYTSWRSFPAASGTTTLRVNGVAGSTGPTASSRIVKAPGVGAAMSAISPVVD